jgi:hypothetical protein
VHRPCCLRLGEDTSSFDPGALLGIIRTVISLRLGVVRSGSEILGARRDLFRTRGLVGRRCKQGLRYAYLIPIFTLAYGPVLLVTRFLGTIAGVTHVVNLRRRLATLEREIVDFALPEGFELEPARP